MATQRVVFSGATSAGTSSLWVTDGTTAGTQNITPNNVPLLWDPGFFGSAGNNIIFQANDLSFSISGTSGSINQLYISNGTAAGTLPVGSIHYTGETVSFGSQAIFDGSDASGNTGLWVTDGTVSGTRFVTAATSISLAGGGAFQYNSTGAALNSTQAMFRDPSGNLWITDGTATGTHAVSFAGNGVGALWSFNGKVLFTAASGLFISDGTSAGTHEIMGPGVSTANPATFSVIGAVNVSPTMELFAGSGPGAANGIWRTDGTFTGTVLISSISSVITGLAALGTTGKAVFTTDTTVYETDGTSSTAIATISSPSNLTTFSNEVWFTSLNASGQQVIWVTDGTAAGTQTVTAPGLLGLTNNISGPYDATLGGSTTTEPSGAAVLDTTTGQPLTITPQPYTGPVAGLTSEYITPTSDSLNMTVTTPGWFIHTGSGNDAIAVNSGTNVLDGSTGSNFLTGGSGNDTFFVDDRGAAATLWDTVNNFHSGDAATIFGVTPSDFTLSWVDGQGATGYTGLTLHATAAGVPTASLTLVGFTSADLTNGKLTVTYGTTSTSGGVAGSTYMYVLAN